MENIIGQKYGRLTVVAFDESSVNPSHKKYFCICDCGNVKSVRLDAIKSGSTISCGCYRKEVSGKYKKTEKHLKRKHGMSYTTIYHTWSQMRIRCSEKSPKPQRYYERGIKVCEEWENSFEAFYNYVSKLEHYGEKGYSLDRINNNGNYEPDNVRWATNKQQSLNKEKTIYIEYGGKNQTLKEWCEELGLGYNMVRSRYSKGWKAPELFSPKRKNQFI